MNKRDYFTFFRSYYEAIDSLPEKDQLPLYKAIFNHSLNFEDPKLNGISKTIWTLIKPTLEAGRTKYLNGTKPKSKKQDGSKTEAKQKQDGSKGQSIGLDRIGDGEELYKKEPLNELQIEKLIDELPNTTLVETIARKNNISKEDVVGIIPEFRKKAETEYLDVKKFNNHFKNWVPVYLKANPGKQPQNCNHVFPAER